VSIITDIYFKFKHERYGRNCYEQNCEYRDAIVHHLLHLVSRVHKAKIYNEHVIHGKRRENQDIVLLTKNVFLSAVSER
jgi:hypothetical protein